MLRRLQKCGPGFLVLVPVFLTFGCGGSGGSTQLRVLAASPDETNVQVLVDNTAVGSPLAYQANTGYLPVHSGNREFAIEAVGTTTNLVPNQATLSLGNDTETTVILAGFSSSLQGLVLTDDNTTPASNTVNLRIVNAAPGLQAVDVYIVPPGTSLSSVEPNITNLGFAQASEYKNLNVGTSANFQVYFTQVGTPFTYLDTGPISFTSGQNRTIVGLNSTSGGSYTFVTLKDLN